MFREGSGKGSSKQRPERGESCESKVDKHPGQREGHVARPWGRNLLNVVMGQPGDQWGWSRIRGRGRRRSEKMEGQIRPRP